MITKVDIVWPAQLYTFVCVYVYFIDREFS